MNRKESTLSWYNKVKTTEQEEWTIQPFQDSRESPLGNEAVIVQTGCLHDPSELNVKFITAWEFQGNEQ